MNIKTANYSGDIDNRFQCGNISCLPLCRTSVSLKEKNKNKIILTERIQVNIKKEVQEVTSVKQKEQGLQLPQVSTGRLFCWIISDALSYLVLLWFTGPEGGGGFQHPGESKWWRLNERVESGAAEFKGRADISRLLQEGFPGTKKVLLWSEIHWLAAQVDVWEPNWESSVTMLTEEMTGGTKVIVNLFSNSFHHEMANKD